jgi:hypothetical protein
MRFVHLKVLTLAAELSPAPINVCFWFLGTENVARVSLPVI